MPPTANQYSEKNIKPLDPREHVRLRPGMYIGGTDARALHHMLYEVLDSATEEVMVSKCSRITVTLRANQIVTIEDNSEGLPIEKTSRPRLYMRKSNDVDTAKPYLEFLMTEFAYKPKFEDQHYGVSGGLHGVGLTAVNCLSKTCTVQVRRDGFLWEQSYEEGLPVTQVQQVRELSTDEARGNTITFQPDFTILDKNEFDFQIVATRCKDLAYLFPAATISVRDLRVEYLLEEIYHNPEGIVELVADLNTAKQTIHPVIKINYVKQVLDRQHKPMDIGVSLAFQFFNTTGITLRGYVNTVPTPSYGVHSETFVKSVIAAIKNAGYPNFRIGQVRLGFSGVIHMQHPDPQFASPTKTNLMNPEVKDIVAETLQQAINTQPESFDMLLQFLRNR